MRHKGSTTLDESTSLGEASETKVSTRRIRLGTFASLRHPNFRYLWFGTLFMSALPFLIGAPATVSYMGLVVIVLAILVAWRAPVVRDIGLGTKS